MNKEEFSDCLKKINITLTPDQESKLNIYADFLIEYNKHTNLTAIKEKNSIYLKHFYDSLTINKYIKENNKVLDIGTGAGFPGMVLAILNPKSNFVLLDSNNKKINFLYSLNEKLNLDNISLVHERAEEYVRNNFEQFDIVTSRAVADLRILLELSLPALKINGLFIPLKSNIDEELNNSQETIKILGGNLLKKEELILPIENSKRTILLISHQNKTTNTYPRSYDKILKKPLKK